jgi:dimethylsulfoniopropionate demethylase
MRIIAPPVKLGFTAMINAPRLAISRRLRKTPFTSRAIAQGVQAFTVYNHMLLPTEFLSVEEDYWHLRSAVQVWDVSVERQVSIKGPDATRLVQWMTPRDIANVALDRCVYLPLADEHGKLLNDPVGIRLGEDHWWLSIADSDVVLWAKGLARGSSLDVVVNEPDVWPLAVQGPLAEELMARVFGDEVRGIRFFRYARLAYRDHSFVVARSGWSKQGGFEIYVDDIALGQALYDELFVAGEDLQVRPGCPNLIERLESGLLAFGNDMDSRHSVLESGLGGFISLDADIEALSLDALRQERDRGVARRLVGLALPALDGPKPLAERPFEQPALVEPGVISVLPEAIYNQTDFSNCLGSQCWSPNYRYQLATAMVEEPQASESEISVTLADGTTCMARICSVPFDFEKLGIRPVT